MRINQRIKFYEEYSDFFETFRDKWPNLDVRERKLLDNIQKIAQPNRRVLDIGCGDFLLGSKLSKLGHFLCGIDVSVSTLKLASRNKCNKNSELIRCIGETLPFKSDSFNVVILAEFLEHFVVHGTILNEVKRVARKDSIIFITVPNYASFCHRLWLLILGKIPFDVEEHVKHFTLDSIIRMLNKNGLKIIDISGAYLLTDMPWPLLGDFFDSRKHTSLRKVQWIENVITNMMPQFAGWLIISCKIED